MRISDWSSTCALPICRRRSAGGGENGFDRVVDLIDRRHAVDVGDDAARVVDRQDRRGLGAIFRHARAPRFGSVVGTALDIVAAPAAAGVDRKGGDYGQRGIARVCLGMPWT